MSLMASSTLRTELFALLATRKEERQARLKECMAPQPYAGNESHFGPQDKDALTVWKALEGADEKDVVEMVFHGVIPRWLGIHRLAGTEPWNLLCFAFASIGQQELVYSAKRLIDLEECLCEVDWESILGDGGEMSAVLKKVLAKYDDEIRRIMSIEEEDVALHQQRMQEIEREKEMAREGYGPLSNVLLVLKCKSEHLLEVAVESYQGPAGEREEIMALYSAFSADQLRLELARALLPDSNVWGDWKGFAVASGGWKWRLSRMWRNVWQRWRQGGEEMPELMQAWNLLAQEWAGWRSRQANSLEHNEKGPLPSCIDAPLRRVEVDVGSPTTSMQKRHCYGSSSARKTPDTHIHNLPDDCLVDIMRRLHTPDCLPGCMDERVHGDHPLQCAVVCKRWHGLADSAVSKLRLPVYKVDAQQLVGRFKHLTALSLTANFKDPLPLADSTVQLKHLELKYNFECPVPLMAQALARWPNLRQLDLGNFLKSRANAEIETILDAVGNLPRLRHLCFTYSGDSLVAICTRVGSMSGLTTVELESAQFPPLLKGRFMEVLRKLKLTDFQRFRIPDYLGLFTNLESLLVSRAVNLRALPESIGRLSCLTHLQVYGCKLSSLPSALGLLTNLKVIEADGMKNWPESFGQLRALEILRMSVCEDFPPGFRNLPRLKHLVIYGGHARVERMISLSHLSGLRVLRLQEFDSLSVCLAGIGMISGLRELSIRNNRRLLALPDSLGLLTDLETCAIGDLPHLRMLPEVVCQWRKLTRLEVEDCNRLQALPEGLRRLPLLRELRVKHCQNLVFFPSGARCFRSLQVLDLSGCKKLTALPDVVKGLGSLRQLNVSQCDALVLPEGLGQRTSLRIDGREM